MSHLKSPPIQLIPVFETCARLMSFRKAAEFLHVTPPAVSQQIKTLESFLDTELFDRKKKQLRLTVAGEYYFKIATDIMKLHQQGFSEFDRRFKNRSLQVSTPLFIAQELLIPNYLSFRDKVPNTQLRLSTGSEYSNFVSDSIDVAIRFGMGPWPEFDCRLLCKLDFSPVCSLKYLNKSGLSKNCTLEDLNNQTLISIHEDFNEWTVLNPNIRPKEVIVCDSYFAVIKSAEAGLGLALGALPAINRLLNEEKLVMPLNEIIASNYGYWMVSPRRYDHSGIIDFFYDWAKTLFMTLPSLNETIENFRTFD